MTLAAPARRSRAVRSVVTLLAAMLLVSLVPAAAAAQPDPDPRIGLAAGAGQSAGQASWNMEKLANRPKPAPVSGTNSDLAFTGDYVVSGNYSGFNVYDVSDPADPVLATSVLCPGSQNDVSVYGDLLFMSVEATSAKIDCTTGGVNAENRFRGVRIWDISDIRNPQHLGGVQTCRGSHTHTLVRDVNDDENIYVYVSGTAGVRSGNELAGCQNDSLTSAPFFDEGSSRWRIEVIKVPLAAPETAEVVAGPRIFADPETGQLNGLQNSAPAGGHPCNRDADPDFFCSPAGGNYSPSPNTNTCHDITAYPELGIAAGACQGNGILLDITDPVNPVRLDAVADENFSYWHSATINNDGTKVIFTDEWGGGGGARCMPQHRTEWGANAIYDIVWTEDGPTMEFASYYKLPVPQTAQENCVAHNGSLVPVPGRDIMVQAWYQGGTSIFDFTDSANPYEIAFFDYGPNHPTSLVSGGYWSTYWYNGFMYGNEIARGFDTFALTESEHLNAVEIAAAKQVTFDEANAQMQDRIVWPATFTTARAWHSAAQRQDVLGAETDANLTRFVDRAEQHAASANAEVRNSAAANLRAVSNQLGDSTVEQGLADALRELADAVASH